jgi:hypothetical protein
MLEGTHSTETPNKILKHSNQIILNTDFLRNKNPNQIM